MSELLDRLKAGDQDAFKLLVREHHSTMVAVATSAVSDKGAAEEVVQETWLAVIKGLKTFEGRSSLKTWIFAILMNQAKKRLRTDGKVEWVGRSEDHDERFRKDGHWNSTVDAWPNPENKAAHKQMLDLVQAGIESLPEPQKLVVILSDVEGFSGPEVSEIMDITKENQRVLLYRARSAVRDYVEQALKEAK